MIDLASWFNLVQDVGRGEGKIASYAVHRELARLFVSCAFGVVQKAQQGSSWGENCYRLAKHAMEGSDDDLLSSLMSWSGAGWERGGGVKSVTMSSS